MCSDVCNPFFLPEKCVANVKNSVTNMDKSQTHISISNILLGVRFSMPKADVANMSEEESVPRAFVVLPRLGV